MPIPLPVAAHRGPTDPFSDPRETWAAFVARRDALVAQMEMATCDGCDGCGQRCVAGFTVTREEHRAVQDYLAAQPAAEVARVLNQNKVAPWPGDDAGTGATFTFCRYRDRDHDNCFVYPARPTVCRLFGHTPWLPCPIEAVAQVPDGSPALWNEYQRQERRTWEDWESRKETAKKSR
jgi:hypothetical protein